VTIHHENGPNIVAATGKYASYAGQSIKDIPDLRPIYLWMKEHTNLQEIAQIENGIIIRKSGKNSFNNYIFIEGTQNIYDTELINLFMTNYAIALDNFILNTMVADTQREIIITFGEVIEKHFDDTNAHIMRISNMMYEFALIKGFSYQESELMKVASTMHDIGKIAIPDAILKKPGKLTAEEFEIIKKHPLIGYQILSKSKLNVLKLAAEIALYHHEKYDGSGYPEGLRGNTIPLSARMLAIIDVFDAITHRRIYKAAESIDNALNYLKENEGHISIRIWLICSCYTRKTLSAGTYNALKCLTEIHQKKGLMRYLNLINPFTRLLDLYGAFIGCSFNLWYDDFKDAIFKGCINFF